MTIKVEPPRLQWTSAADPSPRSSRLRWLAVAAIVVGLLLPTAARVAAEIAYRADEPLQVLARTPRLFLLFDGLLNAIPFALLGLLIRYAPHVWMAKHATTVPHACGAILAAVVLFRASFVTHFTVWSSIVRQAPGWSTSGIAVMLFPVVGVVVVVLVYVIGAFCAILVTRLTRRRSPLRAAGPLNGSRR